MRENYLLIKSLYFKSILNFQKLILPISLNTMLFLLIFQPPEQSHVAYFSICYTYSIFSLINLFFVSDSSRQMYSKLMAIFPIFHHIFFYTHPDLDIYLFLISYKFLKQIFRILLYFNNVLHHDTI